MKPVEYSLDDNIVAIATALVPSALAITRVSGKDSFKLASKFFSKPKKLITANGNQTIYGWIIDTDGQKIDEVIICTYRAPRSFTGEDSLEIISHGGVSVVLGIYKLLVAGGFRSAEKGEFTFRAFINGKTDLTKAEAIKEIVDAKTMTATKNAANRLSGNLFDELSRIKQLIMSVVASIYVEIEYPEDEETTAGSFDTTKIKEAVKALKSLANSWAGEKIFQDGAKVVLAGKTNAGKSLLFNTLLKEERSIVSNIHGTTRDWIDAHCNFNGVPVKIYDTAGIRFSKDSIEVVGIERSKILIDNADLVLYLLDASEDASKTDIDFLQNSKTPILLIRTKIDLEPNPKTEKLDKTGINIKSVSISAKTTEGVSELVEKAYSILTQNKNQNSDIAVGTERQKEAVQNAYQFLEHALQAAQLGFPLDAISQDLEESLLFLGEITGEVRSDDILNQIFSDFCVGK